MLYRGYTQADWPLHESSIYVDFKSPKKHFPKVKCMITNCVR